MIAFTLQAEPPIQMIDHVVESIEHCHDSKEVPKLAHPSMINRITGLNSYPNPTVAMPKKTLKNKVSLKVTIVAAKTAHKSRGIMSKS